MNGVNLRRFEFDYDATWTAFLTDSQLNVYSRYGGRDQGDPESRLSKPSLLHTMQQALTAHDEIRALRAASQVVPPPVKPHAPPENDSTSTPDFTRGKSDDVIPIFQPIPAAVVKPEEMSLLKKNHRGCIHCHQVKEYSLLQAFHDGRFGRELLFTFPLPESLGLEIDRKFGHRIAKILPLSTAAKSELYAGDEIVQVSDVPIRSELDIRWALHRLPQTAAKVTILVRRPNDSLSSSNKLAKSKLVTTEITLPARWREGELSWRKSSRSIPVDWGFRAASMTALQRREASLSAEGLAIQILSVKPRGLAAAVGLRKADVIVALDGERRVRSLEQLRSDMLRQFSPGDEISLTIRRDNETLDLKGRFPDWFTEETSVP